MKKTLKGNKIIKLPIRLRNNEHRHSSRIDRLESTEEIRQLVAKYALALDMRNLDALVALFCEDIRVGKNESGRNALKSWFDQTLRNQFSGTAHITGNHIIEFQTKDTALGVVYSRNEHETDESWVAMVMMYWDAYERIDKTWLFRRRLPLYWYATDMRWPPLGDNKIRWPDREPYEGSWADFWPSWKRFWAHPPEENLSTDNPLKDKASKELYDVAEPVDIDNFLSYMRGSETDLPNVRVR